MMRRTIALLALSFLLAWAEEKPAPSGAEGPAPIDATGALNDARDKLAGFTSCDGTLPMTIESPGQAAEQDSLAVAFQSPNQLRVTASHGEETYLLVFGPETIWAEAREPGKEVQVRKVVVDKIDSFSLGVLKRLTKVDGVAFLLIARPGLLLELVSTCFSLSAAPAAEGKEVALEATRTKEPEGLDEAADVLEGVQKARVVLAADDKRLLEVSLEGGNGGKMTVSYRGLGWDKAPEAAVFEYKAPEGAKVEEIDERLVKPEPAPPGATPEPLRDEGPSK